MLHRLAELDALVRKAYADFDYKRIFAALASFMTARPLGLLLRHPQGRAVLRSVFVDHAQGLPHRARSSVPLHRDLARADARASPRRRSWLSRYGADAKSVHLETFPDVPAAWRDDALAEKWRKVRTVRRVVTGALEIERAQKRIGSSLEAHPIVHVAERGTVRGGRRHRSRRSLHHLGRDAGERRGTGRCLPPAGCRRRRGGVRISPKAPSARARGKSSTTIGADPDYPDVSPRDAKALREWEAMRKAAE